MAITSINSYLASKRTKINFMKTASVTSVAGGYVSMLASAGYPTALALALGNTTTGTVPVAGGTGFPALPTFSNTGYITTANLSVAAGLTRIVDRLFHAGSFAYNASAVTLSSQPSFVDRLPNSSYVGTELWFEAATAFTGIPTLTITYTNQDGVTGKTTGTFSVGVAPTLARCFRIPLDAGDTGIQRIESVTATIATAGTFNLFICRPLVAFSCAVAYTPWIMDLTQTGLPQIFSTTALFPIYCTAATSTGTPSIEIEVADG